MIANLLSERLWAIKPEALQQLLAVNLQAETDQPKIASSATSTALSSVGSGLAIVPVIGPLVCHSDFFSRLFGLTSYEDLTAALLAAANDQQIATIILSFDSPGGEVNGCGEIADLIYRMRSKKTVLAYVAGDAASGAYWLASAAETIFTATTGSLGSLGVVGLYRPDSTELVKIVSSQSPHKRLDPQSDAGKARLQKRIDAMAAVFISDVAKYRGVTEEKVLTNYGAGDLLVGTAAVNCGLADQISSFHQLTKTNNEEISMTNKIEVAKPHADKNSEKEVIHDLAGLKAGYPDLTSQLVAETRTQATQTERERVAQILTDNEAKPRMELACQLAFKTELNPEVAIATLSKAPVVKLSDETGFTAVMAATANPQITPGSDEDDPETTAQRLANY